MIMRQRQDAADAANDAKDVRVISAPWPLASVDRAMGRGGGVAQPVKQGQYPGVRRG